MNLLKGGRHWVHGKAEVPGQCVRGAHRDDSKRGPVPAGFRDQALHDIVNGPIASAGKDHLCASLDGVSCLSSCGAGAGGRDEFGAVSGL